MAAAAGRLAKNVEMKDLCVSMKKKQKQNDSDGIMDGQVGIEKARTRLRRSLSARVHVGKRRESERGQLS